MAVTVEELEQHYKIPEGVLNEEVSDEHIKEISTILDSWNLIASHLDLSKGEIEAVDKNRKTEEEKRLLMLQKWKQALFFKATYKKLLEALLTVRRADQAGKVCQMIMTCHSTQSQGCKMHVSRSYRQCVLIYYPFGFNPMLQIQQL